MNKILETNGCNMNKINLDIIKQFKEVFSYEKDFQQSDYDNFFNEEMIANCKGITWLYWSEEQDYGLIGYEDEMVYALKDEGELTDVCEGLENIPYEMLRVLSFYSKNYILNDDSKYVQKLLSDIYEYESWCKENGIELDKQKVYHDEHGKLFTHYFEKSDY